MERKTYGRKERRVESKGRGEQKEIRSRKDSSTKREYVYGVIGYISKIHDIAGETPKTILLWIN